MASEELSADLRALGLKMLVKQALVEALGASNPDESPLIVAAIRGRADDVASLLAQGADVDATMTDGSGHTALVVACQVGPIAAVERLLAAKASVDQASAGGWTPLDFACYHGNDEAVDNLLFSNATFSASSRRHPRRGAAPPTTAARPRKAAASRVAAPRGGREVAGEEPPPRCPCRRLIVCRRCH